MAASMQTFKSDNPEYVSQNNHHPFQESNTNVQLDVNPCTDGNLCRKSIALASGKNCTNKNPKDKPKVKKKEERSESGRRIKEHRKARFQIHLKKEDGDNETIEYNIDFPNRVAVRMEYLTQSTKVRLNDREFMDGLYTKLIEEERKNLNRATKLRESNETSRVKKLVIEGKMPPPDDMQYLKNHPVFRVNAMLKRLDKHDKNLVAAPKPDVKDTITPVEPYEFNGDQFFTHLHKNGIYWVPSEERIAEEEKVAGKIARAKLRLLEKRQREADQEKMLRLIYADDRGAYAEDDEEEEEGEDLDPAAKLKKRRQSRFTKLEKMKVAFQAEADTHAARFRIRKQFLEKIEQNRLNRVLKRQKERDYVFLEDREKEHKRLVQAHRSRMALKTLEDVLENRKMKEEKEVPERKPFIDYHKIFKAPPTPPNIKEDASFKRVRKAYDVSGANRLSKFAPATNPVVAQYFDPAKNVREMFGYAHHLSNMYCRKQLKADDFMLKLNRMFDYHR